ncbi:MAG: tRNA pseudouridine(55) synthase TruB [Betaproteobacteria bacterium]|nr:tRNA pseudouridine(55) synthase TruB [Betaproteobacteria bacterium]
MQGQASEPARQARRRVDGLLLVDKPVGLTSNAVLQRVKRAYRALKAGHTGTLDPLASGLLPICLGEATKFSLGLLDADKGYRAAIHLGVTTDTGDTEGAILSTRDVTVDRARIEEVLRGFRGEILQVPHRFSAIKRDGRALYSYARAGETVTVAPRSVRIHALNIERWEPPSLVVDVRCSKGTYIRSLGEDIGEALGCGAHLSALRRTTVGSFGIECALTLAAIEGATEAEREAALLPVQALVGAFPVVVLDSEDAARFQNGQKLSVRFGAGGQDALVAVRGQGADARAGAGFLGVARLEIHDGQWLLVPARLMAADGHAG